MSVVEAGVHKLEKLLEHGRKAAWSPVHDVDWNAAGTEGRLEQLSSGEREALRSMLSLVYHSDAQGRVILESLCLALDRGGPTLGQLHDIKLFEKAREFFVLQIDDEARHAHGIELLFKRLKLDPEPQALSHMMYSKVLTAEKFFDSKLILIYWYIEVLAKNIFVELKRRFPETCVDSLFTRIVRDEARHVGFGEIFIPLHCNASAGVRGRMAIAHYSSMAAVPALFRFTRYAKAARVLGLDVRTMFIDGMHEVLSKARRLPNGQRFLDLSSACDWAATLL